MALAEKGKKTNHERTIPGRRPRSTAVRMAALFLLARFILILIETFYVHATAEFIFLVFSKNLKKPPLPAASAAMISRALVAGHYHSYCMVAGEALGRLTIGDGLLSGVTCSKTCCKTNLSILKN